MASGCGLPANLNKSMNLLGFAFCFIISIAEGLDDRCIHSITSGFFDKKSITLGFLFMDKPDNDHSSDHDPFSLDIFSGFVSNTSTI